MPKSQLPQLFLEKLRLIIPPPQWDKLLKTFSTPKPPTFRVNTLKSPISSVREHLESDGFKLESVPWYRGAFILRNKRQRDLEETEIYERGEIYVQNLSSMIPPLVLAPQSGEKVLDLTAAPGSKTTQLSCLMNGEGTITASDDNPIRLAKLKSNLEKQGVSNATLLPAGDGGLVWKNHLEEFDKVLLDAPCSAEGRFLIVEPSSYKYWKEDTNRKMAKLQRRLFKSAFLCLKPGGTMVYSTCTFAPEENEMVLNWALETFKDSLEPMDISLSVPALTRGLSGWEGTSFPSAVTKSLRILPTGDMEAFFVTRLRKTKSLGAVKNQEPEEEIHEAEQ